MRQWRLRVTKLAVAGTDRLFSWLGFGSVEFVDRRPEVLRVTSHRSQIAWSRNRMYNSDTTSCHKKQANDQILIRARIKKTYCKTFRNTLCSSVQQKKINLNYQSMHHVIFGTYLVPSYRQRQGDVAQRCRLPGVQYLNDKRTWQPSPSHHLSPSRARCLAWGLYLKLASVLNI